MSVSLFGAGMEATSNVAIEQVARQVGLPANKVQAAVELLDDGNTVPFITRYRKDQTGGLDEEQIRQVRQTVVRLRALSDRKQRILKSLQSQDKLTDELQARIEAAESIRLLEDLYLPFKPKKRTLAEAARDRGLEPLAQEILAGSPATADIEARAAEFVNAEKGLADTAAVLQGARHLIAETFSENLQVRDELRKILRETGKLVCRKAEEAQNKPPAQQPPASESEQPTPDRAPESEHAEAPASVPQVDDAAQNDSPESPAPIAEASAASDQETDALATGDPPAPADEATPDAVADEAGQGTEVKAEAAEVEMAEAAPAASEAQETSAPVETESEAVPDAALSANPDESGEPAPATEEAVEVTAPVADTSREEPPTDPASDEDVTTESTTNDLPPAEAATHQTAKDGQTHSSTPLTREKKRDSKLTVKQLAAQTRKEAKRRKRQKKIESFKDYFKYQEALGKIPPHRLLAINRGERSKILRVKVEADWDAISKKAEEMLVPGWHPHTEFLKSAMRDALSRLITPSLEREIRREMTERAETHAALVFAQNLRKLLLQPPVRDRRVLAIDPGFRSGCKLAALDEFGNVLGHTVIHVIGKAEIVKRGRQQIVDMIKTYHIPVVAIGNGTACRETERLVADIISKELQGQNIQYVIVNEAGASVYSTSTLGREELPKFDPVLRSAVSIGRRLQDPLSELVKINPANIGVGLYQHDVKASHLRDSLDEVVESCVNFVGVDVNSASPSLLRYVSGLNQLTARRMFEYRQQHGPFRSREDFRKVPGFGEATFVQAAGFLKIVQGDNPLDSTWIHPESYETAGRIVEKLGASVSDLASSVGSSATVEAKPNFAHGVAEESAAKTEEQPAATEDAETAETIQPTEEQPIEPAASEAEQAPTETAGPDADQQETAVDVTPEAVEAATEDGQAAPTETDEQTAVEETAPAEPVAEPEKETAPESTTEAETVTEAESTTEAETVPDAESAIEPTEEGTTSDEPVAAQSAPEPTPEQPADPTVADAPSLPALAAKADPGTIAVDLEIGRLLATDILNALTRPGRDPREDLPPPAFRTEVIKLEDLEAGMELSGTVLNVVDFGAFVDIGLPDSGLIHISRLADRYVKDPHEVVSVGDMVTVWVVEVDKNRRRVSLSAIQPGTETPREKRSRKPRPEGKRERRPRKQGGKPQGRRGGDRQGGRRARYDKPKERPKPPAPPITEKMVEGKEPMRSFSDLLQFYEKKPDSDDNEKQDKS